MWIGLETGKIVTDTPFEKTIAELLYNTYKEVEPNHIDYEDVVGIVQAYVISRIPTLIKFPSFVAKPGSGSEEILQVEGKDLYSEVMLLGHYIPDLIGRDDYYVYTEDLRKCFYWGSTGCEMDDLIGVELQDLTMPYKFMNEDNYIGTLFVDIKKKKEYIAEVKDLVSNQTDLN